MKKLIYNSQRYRWDRAKLLPDGRYIVMAPRSRTRGWLPNGETWAKIAESEART